MRLGLIGLGRIGAFHADTLSHLDGVDSLVVTDAVPAVTASVAERFGAEAADSPEALISSGVDGIVIAAATDAHTALIRAGVDAGIPVFCEKPLSGVVEEAIAIAGLRQRQRGAGPDRLPPPVRPCLPRGPRRAWPAASSAGCTPCGRPPWTRHRRRAGTSPSPAGSSATARSTTSTPCGGSPAGRSSRSTPPAAPAVTTSSPSSATSPPRRPCSPSTTAPPRSSPTPATTRAGTTSGSSCTAPRTVSSPAGPRAHRCATSSRTPAGRPEKPWTFFMDRLADAFRAELTAFTEVVAGQRPSPCTVDDALAVTWIAEAATLSLQQHRPVRIDEVQQ